MEADKWQLQDGGLMMRPMEQMMIPTSYAKSSSSTEKRPRPQRDHALNCPRCNSTNTKFCYYNNYSLTQPRYFCKTCRRYWTEGGSLRNVPVGGGSRKNKRPAFSTSPSPVATKSLDLNPDKCIGSQELSLTFPAAPNYLALSQFSASSGDPVAPIPSHVPSLEFLRTGISSKGISCYGVPPPSMAAYYTPYHQSEMKPSLSFPMEGDSVRTLFPFGEMKPISSSAEVEHQNKEQGNSGGWWNGVLTGGSW